MLPDFEFWVDSQISPIIAKWLKDRRGFKTKSAYSLQLTGVSDLEVYERAKQAGNVILISKDSDFVNLIRSFGSPPRLVNVLMSNCTSNQLWHVLDLKLDEMLASFFEDNIDIIELK